MNFETISDPEKNEAINYINFNQDFSCFMVGTDNGYKIFNTLPLIELKSFEGKKMNQENDASSSTSSLNISNTETSSSSRNNDTINSINTNNTNNLLLQQKRNSITNSLKNLSLRNGSFQQKIKANSILEARNNLTKRSSIYKSTEANNSNSNSNSNNSLNKPSLANCSALNIVEGLYKSNLLAIVGKDINSYFSPNKVILCDMSNNSIISEIQYEVEVKAVRLTEYGLIVVLPTQTFIYNNYDNPVCIHIIETCYNEKGLIAVASIKKKDSSGITIVLPGKTQGEIQILNLQYKDHHTSYHENQPSHSYVRPSSKKVTNTVIPTFSKIRAHKSSLSCLTISLNGEMVASASEQGTIIRVFNLETRQKIHEFRRGTDKAQIYCINFNKDATKICVSSNKGTIHIFNLDNSTSSVSSFQQQQQQSVSNDQDRNSFGYQDGFSTSTMTHYDRMKQQSQSQSQQPLSIYSLSQKIVPKYFIERSWAQFRLPLSNICTFVDTFSKPTQSLYQKVLEDDNEITEMMKPKKMELVALCSNGYIYRFTCITTLKAAPSTLNPNINGDEIMTIHQSHRIQKKKFFKTNSSESEDEDDEDDDIIENFYNEDYIKKEIYNTSL